MRCARLHIGLGMVFAVLWSWLVPSLAAAAPEPIAMGARVTQVDTKKLRATIDKGKKAGLRVGDTGEVFPMRTTEGSTYPQVDFDVRVARARVVELHDNRAVVALEAVADTVEVGAYFTYTLAVPDALASSALFRVTALGIELRPQYEDRLYVTTEAMLADPSQALVDKTLDAMIADIKAMKARVEEGLRDPIQEGKHHGKMAGQIVDELDRAQLLEFLLFVEGFPGKYIGHRWKVPEVYFTWVINGTPSGEANRKERAVRSTVASAKAAAERGKLDEARALWQSVLRTVPDHKLAKQSITRIDRILLLRRTVDEDPDDTASGYRLADELFSLGAYDLALKQNEVLRKQRYEPFKVERMRGYVLTRQQKWKEAAEIFKRLAKERPADKNVAEWLRYAQAKARVAKSPKDASARMELAAVHLGTKSWDAALTEYRKVLELQSASAKQREEAKRAQQRISLQKELDQRVEWVRSDIAKHDVSGARDRIAQVLRLVEALGDAAQASKLLEEFAELARGSSEEDLALELLHQRVERVPDSLDAHTALAFALLGFDRVDEADAVIQKALKLKGDLSYAYLIQSHIARARGDRAQAEKHAEKAAKAPNYPWPLLVLARAEASRDNWQKAVDLARKARELTDLFEIRLTLTATTRGLQAHESLKAQPTSARERLRLIRALAQLGLSERVAEEIAKLPADGSWRSDAWWSLASSADYRILLRDRLAAARNAKPSTEERKRHLAQLEAQAQLRANPKDDKARLALARLYIQSEDFDRALATLGPIMTTPLKPAVGDLVRDAREGITMVRQLELVQEALDRNDAETALRLAREVQALHDRLGTIYARIAVREARGNALVQQGKYDEAIALAEESKAIAAAHGDPRWISITEQRLGHLRAQIGTTEVLHQALERGLRDCDDADDEFCLYGIHVQLAAATKSDGRSAESIDHARKAWNLADRLGRPDQARAARFELADANLTASRFTDAEQIALKLLADSRKAEDVTNEQLSLMVLGAVAMNRGQGKAARDRFREVYDLGTRTGDTSWRALARRFEGSSWLRADHDPTKAAVALEQSAELYERLGDGWAAGVRASVLRELADARLQAGKLASARQAAEQALAVAQRYQRPPALAASQWILALIAIKQNRADEAMTRAKEAVTLAQQTDDPGLMWNAWHALARAHELKGQGGDAVAAYEKSLEHLGRALQATGGENEQQGYMNTGRVREVYKDAIKRFLEAGHTKRAMEILELSRDALLKQSFDPTKIQTKDAKLRAKLDRYNEARARVQGLQKQLERAMDKPTAQRSNAQVKAISEQIAKTRQELNQVVLDLKVTHRHLFQALAMDPQNLVGRRQDLPKDSVLVEYFVAEDALYAFVISAALAQPAVVRVKVKGSELEQTIADFRDALMSEREQLKERDKVEALGRKLDDWLLEPLRSHIDGASTIIILPFGPLYYVPFDALVVSEPNTPVRYAVEDFRISIQTATTLENILRPARPRGAGTMLAVSNPDGSLPGAQREVTRIVKTAIPDAQVLGRSQATVKKFRELAGAFRYLHIATHGVLDADPRKSYLKLSDGKLTVEQISQLQGLEQGNEMVVLSACDTAVEQGKSQGDELVSLAVGFSMAGAPALVASLWEVADDSTAELMATFYRALEQNPVDRLEALRNAKLNLLRMERGKERPFASPWHWASFQLYGDFRAPGARSH